MVKRIRIITDFEAHPTGQVPEIDLRRNECLRSQIDPVVKGNARSPQRHRNTGGIPATYVEESEWGLKLGESVVQVSVDLPVAEKVLLHHDVVDAPMLLEEGDGGAVRDRRGRHRETSL